MLKIDLGNTLGLTRRTDKLSRIVIPKQFMESLNMKAEDEVEIFLLKEGIFVRKKQNNV